MNLTPAQRRTNLLLFVGLVLFAVALCAVILLWMRARTKEQGGKVYPAAIYHSRDSSADYADVHELQGGMEDEGHGVTSHLLKSA